MPPSTPVDPARAIFGAASVAMADLPRQIANSVLAANSRTSKQLIAFAEIMQKGLADVGPRLSAVHERLAVEAQEATLVAYDAARGRTGVPSYRKANRYSYGVLRRAIAQPGFSVGDESGIYFGNTAILDASARQWARLNFGAGGAATSGVPTTSYAVRISNLEVAALSIPDLVRPGFKMPKGRWQNGKFYPRSRALLVQTRGIPAEHWLDQGLRTIAEGIGPAYLQIYREIYNEAKAAGESIDGLVSTQVRPGRVGTSVTPL